MPSMTLRVLLPFEVFADEKGVARIVVETAQGSFGLLPRRLDCVAALVPGILSFDAVGQGEVFLAVDEGVLVKTGPAVVVSVRRALRGKDLARLRDTVEQEFLTLDAQEEAMRTAMARLETGFLRRFATLREHPS
ncbi:F0F1 ATP synthase subunit epsilon [Piscinibacter sp.]|uniref:F0F1 ATP synthase subunit epsilon n=1 Tax=Piscinibacter sp. TaxID=1903157 RepID=UPI002D806C46|nr:F0F1 ATP synthase subunit epsilon [Albitalea sp.]